MLAKNAKCVDAIYAAGGIISTTSTGTVVVLQKGIDYLKSVLVSSDESSDSESIEENVNNDTSLNESKSVGDDQDENTAAKQTAVFTLVGGAIAAVTFAMTPTVLCIAGFGSEGVAAGSFAAWWQSTMPLVAKGSVFSYLQSVTTASSGSMVGLQSISGFVTGSTGVSFLKRFFTNSQGSRSSNSDASAAATDVNEKYANAPWTFYIMCTAGKDMITNVTSTAIDKAVCLKNKGYEQLFGESKSEQMKVD